MKLERLVADYRHSVFVQILVGELDVRGQGVRSIRSDHVNG